MTRKVSEGGFCGGSFALHPPADVSILLLGNHKSGTDRTDGLLRKFRALRYMAYGLAKDMFATINLTKSNTSYMW